VVSTKRIYTHLRTYTSTHIRIWVERRELPVQLRAPGALRVKALKFGGCGLGLRVEGLRYGIEGFGVRVKGMGFRVIWGLGLGLRV
jgi:hypothetical protein